MTAAPAMPAVLGGPPAPVLVLDIGAWSDGRDRYAPLVEQGLARVTAVDATPLDPAALKARGIVRTLGVMLGDGGPAQFRVTYFPGCSSLLEPDPAVIDRFPMLGTGEGGNFRVKDRHDLRTRRLDDVLTEGLPDFIKIDVQGAELDILRHGTRALAMATVVECEVEFLPLYQNQPLFCDVQAFMREHGFVLHKLIDLVGHSLLPPPGPQPVNQLLWGDAVFVRDFTRLDGYDDDALIRAALVLNDCYRSFDLVALLLAEHDRRCGTGYAARYRAALETLDSTDGPFLNPKPA